MASKTISIRDDVYKSLKDARREEESFSDVIGRLLKKDKTDLSEYFGALKDDSRKIRQITRDRDFESIAEVTGLDTKVY